MVYETERLDFCLSRWEGTDEPDHDTCVLVYLALMDLREDPRLPWSAPIEESAYDMWLGEVPDTTVNILYAIDEAGKRIVFWTIDTL